jgi:hypothetical protein
VRLPDAHIQAAPRKAVRRAARAQLPPKALPQKRLPCAVRPRSPCPESSEDEDNGVPRDVFGPIIVIPCGWTRPRPMSREVRVSEARCTQRLGKRGNQEQEHEISTRAKRARRKSGRDNEQRNEQMELPCVASRQLTQSRYAPAHLPAPSCAAVPRPLRRWTEGSMEAGPSRASHASDADSGFVPSDLLRPSHPAPRDLYGLDSDSDGAGAEDAFADELALRLKQRRLLRDIRKAEKKARVLAKLRARSALEPRVLRARLEEWLERDAHKLPYAERDRDILC